MFKQLFSGMFSNSDSLPITDVEQAIQSSNAILLDVREVDEFASGHIPQAINQPLSQLDQFKGDKTKNYLVICQSGMRSQRRQNILNLKAIKQSTLKAV